MASLEKLRGKSIFWVLAFLGAILDLLTKSIVFEAVQENGVPIRIIDGFFYFARVENPGGVFGWFQDYGGVLTVVRAIALFVILWFFWHTDPKHRLCIWAFGLLFAGALGNLYDNLFNDGKVRDWLDFYLLPPFHWHFPTFNVADVMINVGVGLLLLHEFSAYREKKRTATEK